MIYTNLGATGLKVSRICLGTMTYGSKKWRDWVLDEEEARPFYRSAIEASWHQFLRHRGYMYFLGASEECHRTRPQGVRPFARGSRHRHQGLQPHGRRPQSARPLPQAHPSCRGEQPPPPRHRLHRSLPNPPLRLRGPPSRRPSMPSTPSSAPARSSTSAPPPCSPGNSPKCSTTPGTMASPVLPPCKTITTSSTARRSAR